MASAGFKVVDSDGHVMEPWSLYERYTEEPYRSRIKALIEQGRRHEGGIIAILNEIHDQRVWRPAKRILGAKEHWEVAADYKLGGLAGKDGRHLKARETGGDDPHDTIKDLDALGIDVFIAFASLATSLAAVDDPKFESALARAYNSWMRDFCKPYPNRLKGVAILPVVDTDLMIEELERVAKESWCVGILTMGHHRNFYADHPRWYPMYEGAQKHELAVCFHAGGSERPPFAPGRGQIADNPWLMHATAHPWGIQRAMAAVIGGGIYDLFPKLNFVYLESWIGWVPGWIDRLDGEAAKPDLKMSIPKLKKAPSEHLLGPRSYYSFDPSEKHLEYAVKSLGAERVVWASDYPHFDCPWDIMLSGVIDRPGLSERDKRLILSENALRLYPRTGAYSQAVI